MEGQFIIKGEILGKRIKRANTKRNRIINGIHAPVKKHPRLNGKRAKPKELTNEELTQKVALFLESKKDIIIKAFKTSPGLKFYVELKEDTDENANEVTEFVRACS